MNIEVSLKNSSRINTFSDEGYELNYIGNVWEKELLSSLHTKDLEFKDAVGVIKKITGFFSLVYQNENQLIASVDHIRSNPVFYGQTDTTFYLSDCAEWVRGKVNDLNMDEEAKVEFQLAGYVTGGNTLYKNVKQLKAGECLAFIDGELVLNRYYRFLHTEPVQYNEQELLLSLDKVAKKSIQRLIKYANGRQIVIPLSGGYDSRLIAALLKEAGYENILTFTYGVKGNKEAEYSKKVAGALGLEWMFIEYTEELWNNAWHTEERKAYQVFGSGWSSIPHVQDWLAVKSMREQSIVRKDCILVPGHCCVTELLPKTVFEAQRKKRLMPAQALTAALHETHFSLIINANSNKLFQDKLIPRLAPEYPLNSTLSPKEFVRQFILYGWQERQSKFTGNSVRVYEFFEYDWWLPLWDMEFVKFWQSIPLELMESREWYKKYVQDKYLSNSNGNMSNDLGNASKTGFLRRVANLKIIESLKLKGLLRKVYKTLFKPKSHLGTEGRYDIKESQQLTQQGYSSNGQVAYFFLQENSDV